MALTLALRRGVLLHHDRQRGPHPAAWQYVDTPLVARLQGATFGILGLGRIGTAVALRAKAFGFHVLFYDPYKPNGTDRSLMIEQTRSLTELFRRSSVQRPLSLHARDAQPGVVRSFEFIAPRRRPRQHGPWRGRRPGRGGASPATKHFVGSRPRRPPARTHPRTSTPLDRRLPKQRRMVDGE